MKGLITALIMFPMMACAQLPFVPTCISQDSISIKDDGPEKAIVTYYNSYENCSSPAQIILEAPNGIRVRITIEIGGQDIVYKERITIEPLDPNFMSFPPEDNVEDGETKEFLIMGGLA